MQKTDNPKARVTITLATDVLQKFDRTIGDTKRSTAINRILQERLQNAE